MTRRILFLTALTCLAIGCLAAAQAPARQAQPAAPAAQAPPLTGFTDTTAPLFFRETWKHDYSGPTEGPISQKHVGNADLELKLYGDQPSKGPDGGIWENQTGPNDPPHSYTGTCRKPCALTLRHRSSYVDLTGNAKLRWRTKISRLRYLHPVIRLADGKLYVGDYAETFHSNGDYIESEVSFADIKWLPLDINQVLVDGSNNWVEKLDLSKVDEVGFTDLAPGSATSHGSAARSNLDWIEVYGKAVPRAGATSANK